MKVFYSMYKVGLRVERMFDYKQALSILVYRNAEILRTECIGDENIVVLFPDMKSASETVEYINSCCVGNVYLCSIKKVWRFRVHAKKTNNKTEKENTI